MGADARMVINQELTLLSLTATCDCRFWRLCPHSSERRGVATPAMGEPDPLWGAACFGLLDEKLASQRSIGALIPALRALASDSTISATTAGDTVRRWLDEYAARLGPAAVAAAAPGKTRRDAAGTLSRSGWLRKVGASGLTTHRRWVILDGSTLTYFKDASETELKGILRLTGARIAPLHGRVAASRGRVFAFEIATTAASVVAAPSTIVGAGATDGAEAAAPVVDGVANQHVGAAAIAGQQQHGASAARVKGGDAAKPQYRGGATHSASGTGIFSSSRLGASFGALFHRSATTTAAAATPAVPLQAGPGSDGGSGSVGDAPGSSPASPPLNPLHKSKTSYVWIAEGGERERDEWVEVLRAAAARAEGEATALTWARRFTGVATVRDYVRELRAFAGLKLQDSALANRALGGVHDTAPAAQVAAAPAAIDVPADWVRMQMVASARRGMASGADASSTGGAGGGGSSRPVSEAYATGEQHGDGGSASSIFNRVTRGSRAAGMSLPSARITQLSSPKPGSTSVVSEAPGGSAAASHDPFRVLHAMTGAGDAGGGSSGSASAALRLGATAGPQSNRKLNRVLQRREARAAAASAEVHYFPALMPLIPSSTPPMDPASAHEHLKAAVATAEAAAQVRRGGHAPGDRVTERQLELDTAREAAIIVDSVPLSRCNSNNASAALNSTGQNDGSRHMDAVAMVAALSTAVLQAAAVHAGIATSTSTLTVNPLPAVGQEARLLELCRDVLLCSSRTVAGGDTYDLLELVLRNPELVLFVPDTGQRGGGAAAAAPLEISITFSGMTSRASMQSGAANTSLSADCSPLTTRVEPGASTSAAAAVVAEQPGIDALSRGNSAAFALTTALAVGGGDARPPSSPSGGAIRLIRVPTPASPSTTFVEQGRGAIATGPVRYQRTSAAVAAAGASTTPVPMTSGSARGEALNATAGITGPATSSIPVPPMVAGDAPLDSKPSTDDGAGGVVAVAAPSVVLAATAAAAALLRVSGSNDDDNITYSDSDACPTSRRRGSTYGNRVLLPSVGSNDLIPAGFGLGHSDDDDGFDMSHETGTHSSSPALIDTPANHEGAVASVPSQVLSQHRVSNDEARPRVSEDTLPSDEASAPSPHALEIVGPASGALHLAGIGAAAERPLDNAREEHTTDAALATYLENKTAGKGAGEPRAPFQAASGGLETLSASNTPTARSESARGVNAPQLCLPTESQAVMTPHRLPKVRLPAWVLEELQLIARTSTRYRILRIDGDDDDDDEMNASSGEPINSEHLPGEIALVTGHFRRQFPWVGAPPSAMIYLAIDVVK